MFGGRERKKKREERESEVWGSVAACKDSLPADAAHERTSEGGRESVESHLGFGVEVGGEIGEVWV